MNRIKKLNLIYSAINQSLYKPVKIKNKLKKISPRIMKFINNGKYIKINLISIVCHFHIVIQSHSIVKEI
jgi:hypothetical protein